MKVKDGTQRPFLRIREEDKTIVPICVTCADSPLGNCTKDCVVAVILVNKCTKHTKWLVAPVSKT